jgi:hypothetical protein
MYELHHLLGILGAPSHPAIGVSKLTRRWPQTLAVDRNHLRPAIEAWRRFVTTEDFSKDETMISAVAFAKHEPRRSSR